MPNSKDVNAHQTPFRKAQASQVCQQINSRRLGWSSCRTVRNSQLLQERQAAQPIKLPTCHCIVPEESSQGEEPLLDCPCRRRVQQLRPNQRGFTISLPCMRTLAGGPAFHYANENCAVKQARVKLTRPVNTCSNLSMMSEQISLTSCCTRGLFAAAMPRVLAASALTLSLLQLRASVNGTKP